MSIFDRFKDIVSFLNTRPESRTEEQEKIGEELSEAEKTAKDIAESRLEGVTDEEASNFLDTIRDFLNSDQNNINEFKKKNADQIAKDKALFKKFTRLNPVGMVKDFLLKKAIQTYGPAVQEIATKFIAGLEDPDAKTGDQFEFMGTVYTDQDYLEAGRLTKTEAQLSNEDKLYALDQNRGGVSNLKAYISLLPDDYAKLPTQVYNDLRQIKKNHPNTPFADFYDPAGVKTSGLEFILLRANKQNPDTPISKADLLGLIEEDGALDPKVRKTRFNRGEVMDELRMNRVLKNINESIEQMANYSNDQYIYKYYPELQQYLFDVRDAVQLEKDKLRDNIRPDDFSADEAKTYTDALANEFKLKIRQVGEELIKPENIPLRFQTSEEGMFTYNTLIESLLRNLGNNVLTPLLPEQSSDFPTGEREPTYSNMSVTGTTNYDVHGVVGLPRDAINEKLRTDTHYRGDLVFPNFNDYFHFRTGMLEGNNGPVNYFIEVQSDHEEQIRKANLSPALSSS